MEDGKLSDNIELAELAELEQSGVEFTLQQIDPEFSSVKKKYLGRKRR